MVRHAAPCAQPGHFAVERGCQARLFLGANERKHRAAGHGNIGVAGQLQHAQRVQGFFVAPRVAGDDGDAQHLTSGDCNSASMAIWSEPPGPEPS